MSFYIPKVTIDGIDHLPDICETELCQYLEMWTPTKNIELVIKLYMAVADRENYYQNNDPTAFGNPEYSVKSGIVTGIGIAANISEEARDGRIVFRKGNRIILEVDKVNRPENYYEANRKIGILAFVFSGSEYSKTAVFYLTERQRKYCLAWTNGMTGIGESNGGHVVR